MLRKCKEVEAYASSALKSDTQRHRMKILQVQHTKGKPVTTSGTMITANVCYSIQTQRIQYQDKQVWISCTRPWKTLEWSAVSGNVRHWLPQTTYSSCVFITRTEATEHAFSAEFPPAESLLFICPCTSLVIYWETRSSGTNHKA